MKRLLTLLTLTALLLASCAEAAVEPPVTSEDSTPDTTAETAIPAPEAYDFGGRKFTFLDSKWGSYSPLDYIDIAVEEQNGETFNDAVFDRMTAMKDKYSCEVDHFTVDGDSAALSALSRSVMAGDSDYDAVFLRGRILGGAYTSDCLTDMSAVPHIDLTKPWWDAGFSDSVRIGKFQPALIGYTTTNHMNAVWTVCFNKKLISENKLDDPYRLVSDGKWTFDKAIEMSASVARDLDGNTVMDGNDLWGINHTCDTIIGILNSCGVDIAEVSGGKLALTINSQKSVERMTDILTKLFNEDYAMDTLVRDRMKSVGSDGDFFAENKVLFLFTATHLVGQLRQMEIDFGMLPYPKYSEEEDYRSSTAGIFLSMTGVPKSVGDLDETGRFLELFAYEGWRLLKPAFYENVLVGKLARDEESRGTLEYIYGNLTYDAGNILNIGSLASAIGEMSKTLDTNVASFLAEKLPGAEKDIEELNS